jgi:hypothetical protein
MEYLVVLVIDAVLAIDRLFRRRLQSVVSEFDELWNEPKSLLERREIMIGPRRPYAVATVLGGMIGLLLPCGLMFYLFDHPLPRFGPALIVVRISFLAALLGAPLMAIGLFCHWLRGGEMVLRVEGVLLRYRKDCLFYPWAVFERQEKLTGERCVIRPWSPAVPGVIHGRGNTVIAAGPAVRTKQFYFRPEGRIILRDLYAVPLGPLVGLLLRVGRILGSGQPLTPPPEYGDSIPDWMC